MRLVSNKYETLGAQVHRDAFGRTRVAVGLTLFDSKLLSSDAPSLFWDDQQTSGSGTSSTYSQDDARFRLAVSDATAGTRIRQTFRRFNYQPGKSQLIMITFNPRGGQAGIVKTVGLGDSTNGLFFSMNGTTPSFVVRKNGSDRIFGQSEWNNDRLDGQGYSGYTLDTSKVHILFIDFEWLGVGTVRFGFIIDGAFVVCHVVQHANVVDAVYMSTPNLPLRYSISNSGSGVAASLDCICSSVQIEGGSESDGVERSVDGGTSGLTTLNDDSTYPILGLRLKSTHFGSTVKPMAFSLVCTSTAVYRYIVCFNPTFTGTAVTWNSVANSAVEYSAPTNATKVSAEGTVLIAGFDHQTSSYSPTINAELKGLLSLGSSISGTADTLWLCASRITGTTETFLAAIRWRESV